MVCGVQVLSSLKIDNERDVDSFFIFIFHSASNNPILQEKKAAEATKQIRLNTSKETRRDS